MWSTHQYKVFNSFSFSEYQKGGDIFTHWGSTVLLFYTLFTRQIKYFFLLHSMFGLVGTRFEYKMCNNITARKRSCHVPARYIQVNAMQAVHWFLYISLPGGVEAQLV